MTTLERYRTWLKAVGADGHQLSPMEIAALPAPEVDNETTFIGILLGAIAANGRTLRHSGGMLGLDVPDRTTDPYALRAWLAPEDCTVDLAGTRRVVALAGGCAHIEGFQPRTGDEEPVPRYIKRLRPGDGIAVDEGAPVRLRAQAGAVLLVVDTESGDGANRDWSLTPGPPHAEILGAFATRAGELCRAPAGGETRPV